MTAPLGIVSDTKFIQSADNYIPNYFLLLLYGTYFLSFSSSSSRHPRSLSLPPPSPDTGTICGWTAISIAVSAIFSNIELPPPDIPSAPDIPADISAVLFSLTDDFSCGRFSEWQDIFLCRISGIEAIRRLYSS